MCNCIQKLNQRLKAEYSAHAGLEKTQSTHDGRIALSAAFYPRTKNGDYYKHARYLGVRPPFCPFCGKPYQEGQTETIIHNPY